MKKTLVLTTVTTILNTTTLNNTLTLTENYENEYERIKRFKVKTLS